MQSKLPDAPHSADHWTLLRDTAVLQFKLIVDGLRDVILVPASLIAALLSLLNSSGGRPGPQFYRLLRAGKRSERWINLFGAYRHAPDLDDSEEFSGDKSIDDIVQRMETFVVDEYRRGGVTAQAKARIDQALAAMQRQKKPDDTE